MHTPPHRHSHTPSAMSAAASAASGSAAAASSAAAPAASSSSSSSSYQRSYLEDCRFLRRLDANTFQIDIGFVPNMRVPGRFYVNSVLEPMMFEELKSAQSSAHGVGGFLPAVKQIANVASLPGIVGASIGLPDVHSGYGFAIGNVAACQAHGELSCHLFLKSAPNVLNSRRLLLCCCLQLTWTIPKLSCRLAVSALISMSIKHRSNSCCSRRRCTELPLTCPLTCLLLSVRCASDPHELARE